MPSSRFIIYSEVIDLSVATDILGVAPSCEWKKGERQVLRKKDGTTRVLALVHKANGWKLCLPEEDEKKDLDEQIQRWLEILSPKKKELMQIRELGSQMILDCWSVGGSESVRLSPATLLELAAIGIFFDVTFYASAEMPNQSPQRNAGDRSAGSDEAFAPGRAASPAETAGTQPPRG